MPLLKWEPLDFIDVLGVDPSEGEYGTFYEYVVERQCCRLVIKVWPLDSDISIELYVAGQEEAVLSVNLLDCPGVRVVDDKRGRCIELAAANAFFGRYDRNDPAPYGFRIQVDPFVQVTPFSYDL